MVRYYTPAYALALLLSAFLLFSVQPMFSKMILPLLGGTPQVWNTAMVFFQACLLAGYAYAHGTSKYLPLKIQVILHIILLSTFFFVLPFGIPDGWTPPEETDPTFWQLSLMTVAVGGPFFIVAASAPMLQNWFSQSSHPDKDNPYFLYGASNLGSMSALLAYPTLIEPAFATGQQAQYWMGGYACLIAFFALCFLLVRNDVHAAPHKQRVSEPESEKITWKQRFIWIVLSAIPSSLVLGVTTHITTDIASVPMLWVLPLALYLLTFIIVFARRPLIKIGYIYVLLAVAILPLLVMMVGYRGYINPYVMIPFHFSIFFAVALSCHEILARLKPSVLHLTEYFLLMSFGGVIGGIFNSIVAPNVFLMPIEYYLVMGLGITVNIFRKELRLLRVGLMIAIKFLVSKKVSIEQVAAIVALLVVVGTTVALYKDKVAQNKEKLIFSDRNFFGYIRVLQTEYTNVLAHGTTVHGVQSRLDEYKGQAISYYNPMSSISDIFKVLDGKEPGEQKIAVIGLGVGSMNCYKRDGRFFDFFEIDKEMADVAENEKLFTYLSGCGKRDETYDIILGDGRLKIMQKPDGYYDAIFLDAFSSDNIPVHLITTEAIEIYLKKLKPDGVINFHISNNFLDLEPVLTKNAEALNVTKLSRASLADVEEDEKDLALAFNTHSLAFTKSDIVLQKLRERGWNETFEREGVRAWTDQYSNIFSVLGNRSVEKRLKIASDERKAKQAVGEGETQDVIDSKDEELPVISEEDKEFSTDNELSPEVEQEAP